MFCENCHLVWSNDDRATAENCPKCKGKLQYSGYLKEEWHNLSKEEKDNIKRDYFEKKRPVSNVEMAKIRRDLIVSTTPTLSGYKIIEYKDIVFGEVVVPNGLLGAFTSGTFFTISALDKARREAVEMLVDKATSLGANAIVGVDIDVCDLNGHGMMVSANGTAVVVEKE